MSHLHLTNVRSVTTTLPSTAAPDALLAHAHYHVINVINSGRNVRESEIPLSM